MSQKESYSFTVDLKLFIKSCLNDPATKKMVFDAVREDASKVNPVQHEVPLGAANMKDIAGADSWYTVVLGTSTKLRPGQEGYVLRNVGGTGPRVSIKLNRQKEKQHLAHTPTQVLPDTDSNVLELALKVNKEYVDEVAKMQPPTLNIDL